MIFLTLWACGASVPAVAIAEPPSGSAVRLRDHGAGLVLEVATDRYVRGGQELMVVGAVHVADTVFYKVSIARLLALDTVLLEGFVDDVAPLDEGPSGTSLALGLASQGALDTDRPGWVRRDLAESDLQAEMRSDGVNEAAIRGLLVSEPGATQPPVTDTPRGVALGRLRLMHNLTSDETDPLWRRYILGSRDAHVVDGIEASSTAVGIWYGADHLAGIGTRLHDKGWAHAERTWTPAIQTTYGDLQLGPVQVAQLRKGWAKK